MHINAFITYLKTELRYSSHTLISYQRDLEEFQDFLAETEDNLCLTKAEKLHIRNFIIHLSEKKRKAKSINRKIASVKRFYKYLIKEGILENSPTVSIKNLKIPKQVHLPYSETEMASNENTKDREEEDFAAFQNWLIIETLYQTGMRRAELIELRNSSMDFENSSLKVLGKRNKERIIPISDELQKHFIKLQNFKNQEDIDSEHIFCLQNGKKLYPKFVYNVVKKYLSTTTNKDKKSPHMLRHTFATHILNNGAEINAVKELLGHSSLASTQVYTHQDIETLKKIFQENHPREKKNNT